MFLVRVCWVALAALALLAPASLQAQSPLTQFEGSVTPAPGLVPFQLQGQHPDLGRFASHGEAWFLAGQQPGTLTANGVIVLKTEADDTLVGHVRWEVGPVQNQRRNATILFSWRSSVRLSNGSLVTSDGRFADRLPPDMTAQGIIAILIGLLVPQPA